MTAAAARMAASIAATSTMEQTRFQEEKLRLQTKEKKDQSNYCLHASSARPARDE